jgi:hypothetical protein
MKPIVLPGSGRKQAEKLFFFGFVDTGGIDDHHYLNFLFIIIIN